MTAVFLAPVYILINLYVLWRALKWMGACHSFLKTKGFHIGFSIVYVFFGTTLLTGFLIKSPLWLHRLLKVLGNYFLGTFLYIVLVIVLVDAGRVLLKYVMKVKWVNSRKAFVITGAVCAMVIISLSVYGICNARNVRVTNYEVVVEKAVEDMDELRIALIADTHFGYSIGTYHGERLVEEINEADVDIVCIAGDIFDNEFDAIAEPEKLQEALGNIKSTYGVYACWGNHDLKEPILAGFTFGEPEDPGDYEDERMSEFLEGAGITLLNDKSVLVDNKFYIVGRRDASRSEKVENGRLQPEEMTEGMDKTKPIIFIDHQPKELQEIADAGADLDLCGHTHDGQMFPGNFTTALMWENSCGYLQKDAMHNIVTSGVGIWGPSMRVGTKSEVCIIDVTLQERDS